MKKFYLLLIMFSLSIAASAQNQGWLWARSNSNDASSSGQTVATGADGSIYVAGNFAGSELTFGSETYTSDGMYPKMFLVKYDSQGILEWSKGPSSSTGFSEIQGITVDVAGDIFVTGRFLGTLSIGDLTLTNSNFTCFAAKFSPDGNVVWLKQVGSANFMYSNAIATYGDFIYILGSYMGPTITFPSTELNNNGASDVFVAKYDIEGNFYWADSFGGSGTDNADAIEVDSFGNLYLAGDFSASATFAGTTVTSQGQTDIFLLKYNNQEQPEWIKSYGGTQYDWALSLAVDADSNIIASYGYANTVNFEGTTYNSEGYLDSAIIKYNTNGDIQWGKTFAGASSDYVTDLTTNSTGQVFATGYSYSNNVTFGGNNYILPGVSSMFAAMLNSDGSFAWFTYAGEMDGTEAHGIAVDSESNVVVTGHAMDITFGDTLLNAGYNMFVAKYSSQTMGSTNFEKSTFKIYPNPANDNITILADTDSPYTIFDTVGRTIAKGDIVNSPINVSALPSGMYFLTINNTTTKFIKE